MVYSFFKSLSQNMNIFLKLHIIKHEMTENLNGLKIIFYVQQLMKWVYLIRLAFMNTYD